VSKFQGVNDVSFFPPVREKPVQNTITQNDVEFQKHFFGCDRFLPVNIHYTVNDYGLSILFVRFENFLSHPSCLQPIDPTFILVIALSLTSELHSLHVLSHLH
jgi:hypothetical protein